MFQRNIFGQRLKALRKAKKESQSNLAELLGVSANQVSEMERGRKTTSFERLALLCEHFNVCSDYLLGLTDEMRTLK